MFVDREGVPFENNYAERETWPAVIIDTNGRASVDADRQAVLVSEILALKTRSYHPIRTAAQALTVARE